MRVFITGATGFAGSHLVDKLIADGHEISALVHPATSLQGLPESSQITTVYGDLLDVDGLKTAVAEAKPDVIYHLAGQASPVRSWQSPGGTLAVNSVGTANVLAAAVSYGRPRVVVVTSALIYGKLTESDLPVTEETVARPRHPYGLSKLVAGQLVPLYWQHYQLPVVEARPFNHIGARQALGFVVPDFSKQLAAIKLGQIENRMMVGNLEAARDFTDVRDVANAYTLLAEKGVPGESYIICSGRPVKIQSILDSLLELAEVDVQIEQDPARMRPSDTPLLYGSYEKIARDVGWQPHIPFSDSLRDAFSDWLQKLSSEKQVN